MRQLVSKLRRVEKYQLPSYLAGERVPLRFLKKRRYMLGNSEMLLTLKNAAPRYESMAAVILLCAPLPRCPDCQGTFPASACAHVFHTVDVYLRMTCYMFEAHAQQDKAAKRSSA